MGGEGGGRIAFEGKRCNWGETGETAAPEADFSALHQKVFHSTHCTAQHTHPNSALCFLQLIGGSVDIFSGAVGHYLGVMS